MKHYLFVMRDAPHQGVRLQELLDVLLITAAFDQAVSLLFLDDGVFQLKQHQQPILAGLKDTLAILGALELYEVKALVVESESLEKCSLQAADLAIPVNVLPRAEIATWIKQFEIIY